MKLTTEQLKQIIKEELENIEEEYVLHEELKVTKQDIEAGSALVDSPVGDMIFKALDKDPKVQKALQNIQGQLDEQGGGEGYGNVGGQFGVMGAVGGAAAVNTKANVAFWGGVVTKSLGPAALGTLKALGIFGGGMAAGALIGYLMYRGLIGLVGR